MSLESRPDPTETGTAAPRSGRPDALADLQGTAKWLASAGAAVTAVLVAGLQLRSLDAAAERGLWAVAVASLAALVALVMAVAVVLSAGAVLTTERPTVRDLSSREIQAGGVSSNVRVKPLTDALVQEILAQRTHLLGSFDSIFNFYHYIQAVRAARESFLRGERVDLDGVQLDPASSEDRNRLNALEHDADSRAAQLEEAAQYLSARKSFVQLTRLLRRGAIPFAIALIIFSYCTRPTDDLRISEATPVMVYVSGHPKAFPAGCRAVTLPGMAVGGTYGHPVVVTRPAPGCPAMRLESSQGLLVIPELPSK